MNFEKLDKKEECLKAFVDLTIKLVLGLHGEK